jgi:hypothetical protein
MAITVVIEHVNASQTLDIVNDIKRQGMIVNEDFCFQFEPAQYSETGWELLTPKRTVFTFENEKYATLFTIKYIK